MADLIKNGITGVSGMVTEPGVGGIARVEILFDKYTKGYNLAESYGMSYTGIPWQEVVIGDPLCAPYSEEAGKSTNINEITETMSSTPVNTYPQPFKASLGHTIINFTKLAIHTRLQIFNAAGELVYDEEKDTPNNQMEWNTLNSKGEAVSSGIYFYVITDENNNIRKGKLAILR